jgi:hypothetical protein
MTNDMDLARGSRNIFRDLRHPSPDPELSPSILAAQIIGLLDNRELPVRKAGEITGMDAADISRIRCANLGRFSGN